MQKVQPPNEYYLQDLKYASTFLPNILNALGIWLSLGKRKSICKRLVDFFFIFLSFGLIFAVLIPGSLFWVFKGNARTRLRMSTFTMYVIGTIGKYSILILGQDRIRRCWKYIEEDWRNVAKADARNMILECAGVGRRLAAICGWFYFCSGLAGRLLPLLYWGKIVDQNNVTVKLLPNPAYLFSLNMQATPVYEIMYSVQGAYGLVTVSITASAPGLIIVFVMHACGQLKILMNLMREFIEEQRQKEMDKKLANIVEHQIKIRSFLELVEHAMHQISFIEISACIGSSGKFVPIFNRWRWNMSEYCITFLQEWNNSNSMVMIPYTIVCSSAIISMFIVCYTGNQLILQAKTALMTCELEWYRLSDLKARQMVLLMIMSNKPIKITAGKVLDLSLKTFGNIIKASLAYLNMLRNVIG
ncbi:odorant receptor 13a-like [Ooceraea biroi]|uniref:odorant receptor 13a-like n=1 Tax=Ooceraea biroi TaxID=2015173 RepID=UPI000F086E2A|nr:odorant receptor 13a-like [Ooceraea biroi]